MAAKSIVTSLLGAFDRSVLADASEIVSNVLDVGAGDFSGAREHDKTLTI
jgi:hypothetical protein